MSIIDDHEAFNADWLYGEVVEPLHTKIEHLDPLTSTNVNLENSLAIRHDDEYAIVQSLRAVVNAGKRNYGIISVQDEQNLAAGELVCATALNERVFTRAQVPMLVAPLVEGKLVDLGMYRGDITRAYMTDYSVFAAKEDGSVQIDVLSVGEHPVRVVTSLAVAGREGFEPSLLTDELHAWSAAPSLLRSIIQAGGFKKQA